MVEIIKEPETVGGPEIRESGEHGFILWSTTAEGELCVPFFKKVFNKSGCFLSTQAGRSAFKLAKDSVDEITCSALMPGSIEGGRPIFATMFKFPNSVIENFAIFIAMDDDGVEKGAIFDISESKLAWPKISKK